MKKAVAITYVVILLVSIGISYLWCNISPEETYGWFSGFWHGVCFIPNWILSFFMDGRLLRAVNHTTAYSVFWWIFVVLNVIGWTRNVISLFTSKN